MKVQLTIEVRINQEGNYGNSLHLGDTYQLELNTLSQAADILVKLHEACEVVAQQARVTMGKR
jgi:hypothetical protein